MKLRCLFGIHYYYIDQDSINDTFPDRLRLICFECNKRKIKWL